MKSRRWFFGTMSDVALHPAFLVVAVFLIAYPWFTSNFFTFQIGAYSLILGTIALSLMMLAGYGGMISLAQMTVAGSAGYFMAIFGDNSVGVMGLGWPWWLTASIAIGLAALFSAFIGAISIRTEGIYTIMITLAIAVAFFTSYARTIRSSMVSPVLPGLSHQPYSAFTGAILHPFIIFA